MTIAFERFLTNPLLAVGGGPGLEENVNGPSVIEVPDWVERPLGRYYLYFAHHQGETIRLAYGERPQGPFHIYEPGALHLSNSYFPTERPAGAPAYFYAHIASPDVHVVPERREIRMYFHGWHENGRQLTRVATSSDGIEFTVREEILGPSYFRVFRYDGAWFALAMPGLVLRSDDGLSNFVPGPTLFDPNMRHSALFRQDDVLHVFYTRAGDEPESILHATIDLNGDWQNWREGQAQLVAAPEARWEGAGEPIEPSRRGAILERVHQLRDPAIFVDGDEILMFYAGGGEHAIGGARLAIP